MSLQESANKSTQLIKNQTDMDNANNTYSQNYKQAFFPFNPDYANTQFISATTALPAGGINIKNANTETTCKQNAAHIFTKNNKINFENKGFSEGKFQTSVNSDGQTEIKGSLLPLSGNPDATVKVTGPAVFSLWTDMATLNPLASNTQKTPFIVWKHVPVNFLLRYKDFSGTPVIVLQSTSGTQIQTKSGLPLPPPKTPVYYNFNNETKQCTIYKGDISVNEQNDVILWSKPVMPNTTIGLNEMGQLMMYNTDGQTTHFFGEKANSAKNNHQLLLNSIAGTLELRGVSIARGLDVAGADNSVWPKSVHTVLTSKQKTANGMRLPEQQISSEQGLASADNKLLCIIENGALVIKKRIKNNQSIFSIQPDYKMGKTFLTDAGADVKKLVYIDAKHKNTTANPTVYKNAYPPKNAVKSGFYKETAGACDNKKLGEYTHYYEVKDNTTTKCLTPATKSVKMKFLSQNDEYKSSTLYQPIGAIENITQETDGYKINNSTDYSLLHTQYNAGINMNYLIPDFQSVDKKTKAAYGIKTTDLVENTVMPITYEGFETQQETVIRNIDSNIAPIYSVVYGNIAKINQNVQDISAGIQQYRNSRTAITGGELVDGISKDVYYDFSGNTLYTLEKNRSKTAALLKDRETMLTEQNNLYIVSVISVAALFIGAIIVSTSNE